jgi:uncharacterized protein
MSGTLPISIDQQRLKELCIKYRVARIALFGSVLREDFGPTSDVDMLVEFEVGATPGYFDFADLQLALNTLVGRKVDLRTRADLSAYFREDVVREAVVQYAA